MEHRNEALQYDAKRPNMILAVPEKSWFPLRSQRRISKHHRGISVDDPAIDLAVVAAPFFIL
jgi:predicted ATP-dependent serine protease